MWQTKPYIVLLLVLLSSTTLAQTFTWKGLPVRSSFELIAGAGKRGLIDQQKSITRSTLSAYVNWRFHEVMDLKFGYDAIWYSSTVYQLRGTSYDHWLYAAFLGTDLHLHRVILTGGMGKYIHFRSLFPVHYYSKLGVRYVLNKHFTVGFTMRAHAREADYTDFNIGYRF